MKIVARYIHLLSLIMILGLFICSCSSKNEFVAIEHGVVNDGKTVNTESIQKLIDKISAKGGGKLVFPAGKYVTGSLVLKSGVELHLTDSATLLGSIDPRHYKKMELEGMPVSPKTDDNSKLAMILAHGAHDVSITGKGTIDGRGGELIQAIDSLHENGIYVIPGYDKSKGRLRETDRPKILMIMESDNVTVSGITIKNSAVWVQTYELCTNLVIDSVTVESRVFWNNDGMDITDCHNVRITNCNVNAADDGICLKSYYPGHYNDSIYIANCTVRSSASAVKFGTASIGGFKNVFIENIKVFDTFRSVIAIESVDGCDIENVHVSNMVAKNTGNAVFIRLGHRSGEKPGVVKNITIKDIVCEVPYGRPDEGYAFEGPMPGEPHNQYPASIVGIPGHYVQDVTLENIEVVYPGRSSKDVAYVGLDELDNVPEVEKAYPEFSMFGELPSWGFFTRHVKGLAMKNVRLKLKDSDFRPALVFDDVIGLNLSDIELPNDNKMIAVRDVEKYEFTNNVSENIKKILSNCKTPEASDLSYRFKDEKLVSLSTETEGAKIYYTLDGKTPTQKSKLYTGPINLNKDTHVQAIAIADGYYPSNIFSRRYVQSILDGLSEGYPKISFEKTPDKYGSPDGSQLIDQVFGSMDFRDGKWTGLNGEDLVITFDFGEKKNVSSIQFNTLTQTYKWRFPPKSVTVFVENNSGEFDKVAYDVYDKLTSQQTKIDHFKVKFTPKDTKRIKIRIENYGELPSWHKGAGKLPWIFVDEINVN